MLHLRLLNYFRNAYHHHQPHRESGCYSLLLLLQHQHLDLLRGKLLIDHLLLSRVLLVLDLLAATLNIKLAVIRLLLIIIDDFAFLAFCSLLGS